MALSFTITDASPLWFYSPSAPYFDDSNLKASWNQVSHNSSSRVFGHAEETYHETLGPAGVILPEVFLTSWTPIWDPTDTYNVRLRVDDKSGDLPVWQSGQTHTQQFAKSTFELQVACSEGITCIEPFRFKGAKIETLVAPEGKTAVDVTIDDTSPIIQYSDFAPLSASHPNIGVSDTDHQGTLSMTPTPNASAVVTFKGASIAIRGVTGPSLGPYTVHLDGVPSKLLARRDVVSHDALLFFATGLDTSRTHDLRLTAVDGGQNGTGVILDKIQIWGTEGNVGFIGNVGGTPTTIGPRDVGPTGSSNNTIGGVQGIAAGGSSAGVIVGAILGTLAGILLLFLLFRRLAPKMTKKADKTLNPWDQANMLQNMKQENVLITLPEQTRQDQRYVYRLIAHSELRK